MELILVIALVVGGIFGGIAISKNTKNIHNNTCYVDYQKALKNNPSLKEGIEKNYIDCLNK